MYIDRIISGSAAAPASAQTAGSSGTAFASILGSKKSESELSLDDIFEAASQKYNVPVSLLKAVAKAESNFRADATSCCGAMGIMQLMPGTAKSLGVTDAYDPEQNIMGGAKYLSQLLNEFGDTALAVAAYNAGPGNVRKYNGIPPFEETQNYVEKVLGYCGSNITAGSISAVSDRSVQNTPTAAAGDIDPESLSSELLMSIYQMQIQLIENTDTSIV